MREKGGVNKPGINSVLKVGVVGELIFFNKAAQTCWCYWLFNFYLEISVS